jgi:serine/threonine protein kinase
LAFAPVFTTPGLPSNTLPVRGLQAKDVQELLSLFVQCCEGIAFAHTRGVLHRDIKPSNLLVGNDGLAKVSDFGLAVESSRKTTPLTASGAGLGTHVYMSPEQLLNAKHVKETSDIYSLGVTLFELLTGTFPSMHLVRPPIRLPGLSSVLAQDLFDLIDACIDRSPANRPSSVQEVIGRVRPAIAAPNRATKSRMFDVAKFITKAVTVARELSKEDFGLLGRIRDGETVNATTRMYNDGFESVSDDWRRLTGMKPRGLVTFTSKEFSNGKHPRANDIADVALTPLGVAVLRLHEQTTSPTPTDATGRVGKYGGSQIEGRVMGSSRKRRPLPEPRKKRKARK